MPAPIVVEVYSPQPKPEELAVLIAACTRAATPNECITAEQRSSESPLGVAIVRRDGDRARIELGLRSVVSAEWSTRDLVFQPGDDELERYRAIGFAIGTLVARRLEPAAPPEKAPASTASPVKTKASELPTEPPRRDAPPASPPRKQRSTWLDLSGTVGLGLIPGPPRAGGSLRAASELSPAGFFATFEVGYAERSGDEALRASWLSVAFGLGHPLGLRLRSLGVDGRLLVVVERLSLSAVEGSRTDGATRYKPGLSAAIDAHWELAQPVSLVISAATLIDPERTVIKTAGTPVAETPALGLSGFVGLRLRLR